MSTRSVVVALLVLQVWVSFVGSQSTEQDDPPTKLYSCEDTTITCRYGFVVDIMEVKNGFIDGGCSPNSVETAPKQCVRSVSATVLNVQKVICNNMTWCPTVSLIGNPVCIMGQDQITSNYGEISYVCRFVTTSPTTTPPTSKAATTKTLATKTPSTKFARTKILTTKTPSTKPATTKTQTSRAPITTSTASRTSKSSEPIMSVLNETRLIPDSTHLVMSLVQGGSPLGLMATILLKLGG